MLVMEKHPVINMAKIPAKGVAGLIFAVTILTREGGRRMVFARR